MLKELVLPSWTTKEIYGPLIEKAFVPSNKLGVYCNPKQKWKIALIEHYQYYPKTLITVTKEIQPGLIFPFTTSIKDFKKEGWVYVGEF